MQLAENKLSRLGPEIRYLFVEMDRGFDSPEAAAMVVPTIELRLATPADARLLATHRVGMFHDMGRTTPEIEQPLLESSAEYLARALSSGEYVGWIAHLTA